MSELEKFLKIKGVSAAGEFTSDGKCKAFNGKISKSQADEISRYCATLNKLLETFGSMNTKIMKLDMEPYHGFVHCGGKWTIVSGKDHFAVADETADWNEVSYAALMGEFPE